MSSLTDIDKRYLERILEMGGGGIVTLTKLDANVPRYCCLSGCTRAFPNIECLGTVLFEGRSFE